MINGLKQLNIPTVHSLVRSISLSGCGEADPSGKGDNQPAEPFLDT